MSQSRLEKLHKFVEVLEFGDIVDIAISMGCNYCPVYHSGVLCPECKTIEVKDIPKHNIRCMRLIWKYLDSEEL